MPLWFFPCSVFAVVPDSAVVRGLHLQRIHTDMKGMSILAGWGFLNLTAGVMGNETAEQDEAKRFRQMNALWGAVNLGIAGLGYFGARRELQKPYTASNAIGRYRSSKRIYLINAGLDGLYIATGVYLIQHANHSADDRALYRGFGKSLVLQGLGLLTFDVAMYSKHQHARKGWTRAIQGLSLTGNGLGWRYVIR